MLAVSPRLKFVKEPFHLGHDRAICSADFKFWYTYIFPGNEDRYRQAIKSTLELRYNLITGMSSNFPRGVYSAVRKYIGSLSDRKHKLRPLVKDPIALLSAPWLANNFNMDVVVLIRHPAAFVSSVLRKNWTFHFEHLLSQTQLMDDVFHPYEDEIRFFAVNQQPLLQQAILSWKLLHYVIHQYQQKYPDWLFVRHEDLSRDPYRQFTNLYSALNVDIPDDFERAVQEYCFAGNYELGQDEDRYKRSSMANIYNWKQRLSENEIAAIQEGAGEMARLFYSDEELDFSVQM